jgi:hypothetical protein
MSEVRLSPTIMALSGSSNGNLILYMPKSIFIDVNNCDAFI